LPKLFIVRPWKGSSLGQNSIREIESSNEVIPRQSSSKRCHDSQKENLVEGSENKADSDSEGSLATNDGVADKLNYSENKANH
jgi:hypothetical protein